MSKPASGSPSAVLAQRRLSGGLPRRADLPGPTQLVAERPPHAKHRKAVPVDITRHSLEIFLAQDANDTFPLTKRRKRLDKRDLSISELVDDALRIASMCRDLTAPLYEQKITDALLNGAQAGKNRSAKLSRIAPRPSSSRASVPFAAPSARRMDRSCSLS